MSLTRLRKKWKSILKGTPTVSQSLAFSIEVERYKKENPKWMVGYYDNLCDNLKKPRKVKLKKAN